MSEKFHTATLFPHTATTNSLRANKRGTLVFYDSTLFHMELRGERTSEGIPRGAKIRVRDGSKEKSTVTEFRVISPP